MTRLVWDQGRYEVGLDQGVFYSESSGPGVVWNGLSSITDDTDVSDLITYQEGIKIQHKTRSGEFVGVIQAYTYPDAFYNDVLLQYRPKEFGLSYRVTYQDRYKIHLVYNVAISPGDIFYEQSEFGLFRWNFTTRAIPVPEGKKSAHLIIDVAKAYSSTVEDLENALYGDETQTAHLPTPEEVFQIFEDNSIVRVIDNGDGSFTVIGPDDAVHMVDPDTFEINWPSVIYIDAVSYKVSSL